MEEIDLFFGGPRPSRILNGPDFYGRTALDRGGVNFNSNLTAHNPRWMSSLDNSIRISELSIPGTHGSMALHSPLNLISDYVINQTANLTTQLNAGIRYIDIRCRHYHNLFAIHHGAAFQHAWFDTGVLDPIRTFLRNNPGETILMRVQQEYNPTGNTRSFEATFAAYHNRYQDIFWNPTGSTNPTLGETRGKIILLQQFQPPMFGIRYADLSIQDMWNVTSTPAMYQKWIYIRNHFNNAMNNRNRIHINHLSGNGGLRNPPPWKIASGYWFRNNGSELEEVIPFNQSSQFSDWPRDHNRLIYRGGTNLLTTRRIVSGSITHTGIIAADFPGSGLIQNTINLNTRTKDILFGTYKIVTLLNNKSLIDLSSNTGDRNVHLWEDINQRNAHWDFSYDSQRGAYVIRNSQFQNLVLSADSPRTNNVFGYPFSNFDSQHWILETHQRGYVFRNFRNRDLVLHISGGSTGNRTNVVIYPFFNSIQQIFRLERP
ncbi:phosphatidylinositol-specific phospholipase C domain-containing protein [Lysinibacillus sphaericus]|uniref:phosphatidylinositol-specific phospholipase C domain-containing protein n=1 Tax=Lysinibacillus sphaericus TaxID=1421 RepID=UPI00068C9FD9|nr:phosphatidylinositol-specific phospholipase C domain-containing protein [Lysinibacillus sphaericus]QTB15497.1 phosphatidylinositol-specific phospholipase C domain-containing protein [Lysinibacillus sphaericus]QTB20757.1 phosphatidylinositol-specific phospholipase C domain-containing protein [Lysinibacillus sphaericus]